MEIFSAAPFIPGEATLYSGPLARYLPPLPDGVVSAWLHQNCPPGVWVLDPFGSAPRRAVEAARAGFRVLVASNNPVDRLLLDLFADPPSPAALRAALADLASSYKGSERIEPHLRALYSTSCNNCGQAIMAEAFVWDRGADTPSRRIYKCPNCADAGEHPATQEDEALAARYSSSGLHRSRALERVAAPDDPDRHYVEEAVDTYLPRAIYAIFTLLNKVESLPPQHRRPLTALFLAVFDQGNTLWQHPTQRARPRQLITPTRFRENNIWLAMEEAVEAWSQVATTSGTPVSVDIYPRLPTEISGICLFEGRLKDLSEQASQLPAFKAVIAALPRPNQAYWTLSALWAGWLWGRETAALFKSVLHRRRYDWAWHTAALQAAFSNLGSLAPAGAPMFGYYRENEPGYITASMLASKLANLSLVAMAMRNDHTQIHWRIPPQQSKLQPDQPADAQSDEFDHSFLRNVGQSAALDYLRMRGEPASYLALLSTSLAALVTSPDFRLPIGRTPAEIHSQVQNGLQAVFSTRSGFTRFGGSSSSPETGQWWLDETDRPQPAISSPHYRRKAGVARSGNLTDPQATSGEVLPALADRIEIELVRFLLKQAGTTQEIDSFLCSAFPGMFTADPELIQVCLESYADQDEGDGGIWRLRSTDLPKTRRADLLHISNGLNKIGVRLGFKVIAGAPDNREILWQSDEEVQYAFHITASAVIDQLITRPKYPPERCLVASPGSRAGLIGYKIHANPRLSLYADRGWRFIKFRHIFRLLETENLSLENLDHHLSLDPLTHQYQQMQLL